MMLAVPTIHNDSLLRDPVLVSEPEPEAEALDEV